MKPGYFRLLYISIFLVSGIHLFSQQYHPLPVSGAYWSVNEFDESTWTYNDVIYSVNGDTLLNGILYSKIFRLDDYPTLYDTVSTLHGFMRQDIAGRKVYFIRHYLGEKIEKQGYDFSVSIGDTVFLPAFDYGNVGDSLFVREAGYCDSIQLLTGEYRKMYFFRSPFASFNHVITFIEGIGEYNSTIPGRYTEYDAFHLSFSNCVQIDGQISFSWFSPADSTRCGFNFLGLDEATACLECQIFPNPAAHLATVNFPLAKNDGSIFLIDLLGRRLRSYSVTKGISSFVIDVSTLPQGSYFLDYTSGNNRFRTKLLVNH